MRKSLLSFARKKLRFCDLDHLGNLVLAILANLVNLPNWVLTILVKIGKYGF